MNDGFSPDTGVFGSGSVLGAIASGEVNGYPYIMQLKDLIVDLKAEGDRLRAKNADLAATIERMEAASRYDDSREPGRDTPR